MTHFEETHAEDYDRILSPFARLDVSRDFNARATRSGAWYGKHVSRHSSLSPDTRKGALIHLRNAKRLTDKMHDHADAENLEEVRKLFEGVKQVVSLA